MSRKPRPLGSVRVNSSLDRSVAKLEPIPTTNDALSRGIMGASMNVPPPKPSHTLPEKAPVIAPIKHVNRHIAKSDRATPYRPNSIAKSDSSAKSDESGDKRELKESQAREKELKQKVTSVQKTVEELKAIIVEKEKIISDLQTKIIEQEVDYKELLEKERKDHAETKNMLTNARDELTEKCNYIDEQKKLHAQKISEVTAEMERRIAETAAEKDKEIAIRDEKLNKLKMQMANALKGNSWERQQQLDELTKELTRIQEEADLLRMKLKSNKNKSENCFNCQALTTKLDFANKTVKEKEKTIKDLESLCKKFEKQLTQQDELLKQWADTKGRKVLVFPK